MKLEHKLELEYKKLPSCDVLVAGGGPGGCAAAISAARGGANTALIEKNTFLGGMATGGLVTPMMKNACKGEVTLPLLLEVCDRLVKAGGGAAFQDGNPGWFNPEVYKWVLDEICMEANVKLMFDCQIISTKILNRKIEEVFFVNKGGCFSIQAKEFIDATGDGDLIALSGVSYKSGELSNRQAMSLRFMMSGVDLNIFATYLKENDKSGDSPVCYLDNGDILLSTAFTFEKAWTLTPTFTSALKAGDLKEEDAAYFQIFSVPFAKGLVAFNCPRISAKDKVFNPLSNEDISCALVKGRQMIKRISNFCKKYLPGFGNSYICQIAPNLGIRETRRLVGQYVLTKEDILSAKKFDDGVASSNWPIDIHPSELRSWTSEQKISAPKKGDYYQIPLRSLLPKEDEISNLIVAGRCLSSTFEAQSSARIQANCWAMGEAAGLLAARRVKEHASVK